jgi:putative membrane protein
MEQFIQIKQIVSALLFSIIGIVALWISTWILDQLTPGDLWKEIILEKNLPLALVVGAKTIAIALIVAAAIHG